MHSIMSAATYFMRQDIDPPPHDGVCVCVCVSL